MLGHADLIGTVQLVNMLWSHPAGPGPKVPTPPQAWQHLPMAQALGFLSVQPADPLKHVLCNGSDGGGSHKSCSETQLI